MFLGLLTALVGNAYWLTEISELGVHKAGDTAAVSDSILAHSTPE